MDHNKEKDESEKIEQEQRERLEIERRIQESKKAIHEKEEILKRMIEERKENKK